MSSKSDLKREIHHGNQFTKIYRHGFWYLFNSLGTKLISVFLLPIITRYVSPEEYGLLSSFGAITQFLPIIISLYIDSSFIRFYYEEKNVSHDRIERLYSTLFWFVLILGLLVILTLWGISQFTIEKFFNIKFWPIIPLITLPALFNQLNAMASQLLRAELKSRDMAMLGIFNVVTGSGISVVLLVYFNMGIVAILISSLSQSIFSLVYYIKYIRHEKILKPIFDFAILKRSLFYSLPMIPSAAGGWVTGFSDRIIMTYYGAISQLGLYAVAFSISRNIYYVNDAVTQVQSAIAMSALSENLENGKKLISEFITYYLWLLMLIFLMMTLFSHEVMIILTAKKYHEVYNLVGLTAFPYVLSGIYRTYTTLLSYHKKMWVLSASGIMTPLISLALNFYLIPRYGYYGMAFSFLGSTTFNSIWIILWSQYYNKIPLQWTHIWQTMIISTIVLVCYAMLESSKINFITAFVVKVLLIMLYISSLVFFKGLRADILPHFTVLLRKFNKVGQ